MTVQAPTPEELAERARAAMRVALDAAGLGTTNLRSGSRLNVFVSVVTGLGVRLLAYVVDRVAAAFFRTSTGTDLDVIGADVFKRPRKDSATAEGYIRLTRSGTAATSIPGGSRFATEASAIDAAVVYETPDTVSVGDSVLTVDVPLVCQRAGVIGNRNDARDITKIVDSLPDTSWAVSTPTPSLSNIYWIGGGADVELDADYKARLGVASPEETDQRAVRVAVLAGVLGVPGVAYATVVEGAGLIYVFVGDSGFNLPAPLKAAVLSELDDWRALGVVPAVLAYTKVELNISATVYMARAVGNYSTSEIVKAATEGLETYLSANRAQPDEYFVNLLESAVAAGVAGVYSEVQDVVITAINGVAPADVPRAASYSTTMTRYVFGAATVTVLDPQTS